MKELIVIALVTLTAGINRISALAESSTAYPESKSVVVDADSQKTLYGRYLRNLQTAIKSQWNPPEEVAYKHVTVRFAVLTDGSISDVKVSQSSGNQAADKAAIDAVMRADVNPLPFAGVARLEAEFRFDEQNQGPHKQVFLVGEQAKFDPVTLPSIPRGLHTMGNRRKSQTKKSVPSADGRDRLPVRR